MTTTASTFSLIRGDALFRIQQAIGLIGPGGELRTGRRAGLLVLVTWVPIVAWAAAMGRAVGTAVEEPLFEHFGVHVRTLIAIPLLVLADATTQKVMQRLIPYFVTSGLVDDGTRARFEETLAAVARLRNRWLPWVLMIGLVLAWTLLRPIAADMHELRWATDGERAPALQAGFGGWWFLNVVRPIFTALLLAWIWRLVLVHLLFRRLARLELSLVPTHPDRVAGLGFLNFMPLAFAPIVLAISAVASSRWAHDVLYHDVALQDLRLPAAALLTVVLALTLGPLLAFRAPLARAKRRALLEYGALVGEHGRRVHRRWILRQPLDDDTILSAPELGPVADTGAIYEAVRQMRPVPIGMPAVAAVILPAILPMFIVAALRVPAKDLLLGLVKVLL